MVAGAAAFAETVPPLVVPPADEDDEDVAPDILALTPVLTEFLNDVEVRVLGGWFC